MLGVYKVSVTTGILFMTEGTLRSRSLADSISREDIVSRNYVAGLQGLFQIGFSGNENTDISIATEGGSTIGYVSGGVTPKEKIGPNGYVYYELDIDEVMSYIERVVFPDIDRQFPPSQGQETSVITEVIRGTMNDVVIEGYKKRSLQGEIFNNPMSQQRLHLNATFTAADGPASPPRYSIVKTISNGIANYPSQCYAVVQVQGLSDVDLQFGFGVTDFDFERLTAIEQPSITDVGALSASKARASLQGSDLDLLVSAAELPETFKYLLTLFRRAAAILGSIKNGKWKKYAPKLYKRLKKAKSFDLIRDGSLIVSEIWLEMRYAIRPIMYDIEGTLKVLNSSKRVAPRQTFRGTDKDQSIRGIDEKWARDGLEIQFLGTSTLESVGRSGILGAAITDDGLPGQLGLTNVASLGLELITLSFVVTWFINVGNMLYFLQPNATYSELAAWTKVTHRHIVDGTLTATDPSGQKSTANVVFTASTVSRNPMSMHFHPTVNINLDVFKLADLAALFRSFLHLR